MLVSAFTLCGQELLEDRHEVGFTVSPQRVTHPRVQKIFVELNLPGTDPSLELFRTEISTRK